MGESEFGYEQLASVSWYYVASLLIIGLFFKFNRFWSIRNLDLVLIVLIAPGALMVTIGFNQRHDYYDNYIKKITPDPVKQVADKETETSLNVQDNDQPANPADRPRDDSNTHHLVDPPITQGDPSNQDSKKPIDNTEYRRRLEHERPSSSEFMTDPEFASIVRLERNGYLWLFAIGLLLLIRMLLDSGFSRRPLLEPNLTVGGLAFLGCSLLAFVVVDVARNEAIFDNDAGAKRMIQIVKRESGDEDPDVYSQQGPGYALLHILPAIPTFVSPEGKITGPAPDDTVAGSFQLEFITKALAIASQLGIVAAIVLIGYRHFGNFNLGVTVATLYLMLPYTAETAGQVFHVLPALLLVWAIVNYRRPFLSGILIGLAAGVFYYPMFLLPLWFSYYWDRGRMRFLLGFLVSVGLVVASLIFVSQDVSDFFRQLQFMFGFWLPKTVGVSGIWALGWDPWFRLPLLAGFFGLSFSFALWPIRKDLGTLISCTAAVMLALQFCHGFGGGMFIAWYLPLLLLTVFRPSLEDRTATSEVTEKWFAKNGLLTVNT